MEDHAVPRGGIQHAWREAQFLFSSVAHRGPPFVLRVKILAEWRTARVSLGCPERCCGTSRRLPRDEADQARVRCGIAAVSALEWPATDTHHGNA
jgi:hypothetical protein